MCESRGMGTEGQERRGVKTSYPAAVTGNVGMEEVTFVFKIGKW